MYAIVRIGSRQYRVEPDQRLKVDRLKGEAGQTVALGPVLAVGDGEQVHVGQPHVTTASVSATILRHIRGPKLIIFKFKAKKNYRNRTGHRQNISELKITGISLDGKVLSSEKSAEIKPGKSGARGEGDKHGHK